MQIILQIIDSQCSLHDFFPQMYDIYFKYTNKKPPFSRWFVKKVISFVVMDYSASIIALYTFKLDIFIAYDIGIVSQSSSSIST